MMRNLVKYPKAIVDNGERSVGYFTAALRAGVSVIREIVNSDEYKDVHGYDEIPVNMEYPQEKQHYPYIHVMYQNSSFKPSSLEEKRIDVIDEEVGDERLASYYIFEGSYIVGIYANTILERDSIADCLIGAIGIDDTCRNLFYANKYINVTPNMHTLQSPTANESIGTPWDSDALTCYRQLKFEVSGEFAYRHERPSTYIEKIDVEGWVMDAEPGD